MIIIRISVEIYNLEGKKVQSAVNTEAVQLNNLSKGIYILQLTNAEGVQQTEKVIVK